MIKNSLNRLNLNFFEKKIISKNNRFKISNGDKKELYNFFLNKTILVTGASGSIGSKFVMSLLEFSFKKLFLLDKNENDLTTLNRKIIYKVNKKNIQYICADINNLNLDNFLTDNKINIYLNFAAIKHVRSEENLYSIKYMFSTNYENFFNIKYKSKYLKKIFSISTDKAADPSSLMGASKAMMEYKLKKIIEKYDDISVCSARFANVSFSKGSILEYALDCIKEKISFGIPANIKRYFITHEEAISICYHALLKKNNNSIVIPNKIVLGSQIRIKDIIDKISKIYNYKFTYKKKFEEKINKKKNYIYLTDDNIVGQKMFEKFSTTYEDYFIKKSNSFLDKLSLDNLKFINLNIYNKIKFTKNIKQFKYLISNLVPGYKFKSRQIKVSQII